MQKIFFKNVGIWLFLVVIFLLNLQFLGKYDVWRDESFSINVAKQSVAQIAVTISLLNR